MSSGIGIVYRSKIACLGFMLLGGIGAPATQAVHADSPTQLLSGKQNRPLDLPGMLGFTVYEQPWDPLNPAQNTLKVMVNQPNGLANDVNLAWNQFATGADGALAASLNGFQIYKPLGMNLYNVTVHIGSINAIHMLVNAADAAQYPGAPTPTASRPVLVIQSSQARIDAASTSDVTTRGTDPTFYVTFNLTAFAQFNAGAGATSIDLAKATVVISSPQYVPGNVSANAGAVLSDAWAWIANSTSMQDQIQQSLNGLTEDITQALKPYIVLASAEFLTQAPKGWGYRGVFASASGLSLIIAPPPMTPNTAGQIAGQLNVTVTAPNPGATPANANCSNTFAVSAQVQVGPPMVTSLNPLSFGNPPNQPLMQALPASVSGGSIVAGNGGWSCGYVINGLASGFANNVSFPSGVKSAGGLPTTGSVLDVSMQNCTDPVPIPRGSYAQCNLSGTQHFGASQGVGVARQSATARGFINPGDPAPQSGVVGDASIQPRAAPLSAPTSLGTPASPGVPTSPGAPTSAAAPTSVWGTPGTQALQPRGVPGGWMRTATPGVQAPPSSLRAQQPTQALPSTQVLQPAQTLPSTQALEPVPTPPSIQGQQPAQSLPSQIQPAPQLASPLQAPSSPAAH